MYLATLTYYLKLQQQPPISLYNDTASFLRTLDTTHFWRVSSRRTSASSSFPALTRQKTSTWVSLSKDARIWAPRKPDAPVRRTRWGGRTDVARNREYLSRVHHKHQMHHIRSYMHLKQVNKATKHVHPNQLAFHPSQSKSRRALNRHPIGIPLNMILFIIQSPNRQT